MSTRLLLLVALLLATAAPLRAQPPTHALILNADQGEVTISRHIYGHFAEHLGRAIYDGFWKQNDRGEWYLRQDVIDALRRLNIPNLRWPGGCFADTYHWRDGVGPQEERPAILNVHWGGVTEDNSFGTHEFMQLVDALGTEAYIAGNVGSGTVQEMADWVQYMTFAGDSPMADLRREHGRAEPWRVPFWGVGNENWGCGGNMRPEYYADLYRQYATYLRDYSGNDLYKIAGGANSSDYRWTEVLMREAGRWMDGLSVHYYVVVHSWQDKGSATDFDEQEWFTALQKALFMDELLSRHIAIMDQYDPQQRVGLMVDEWGIWHNVEPGTEPGFLYQQNTLRDALIAALTLNIFNHHADRVRMANIAQTVNVLQAMILTQGDQMILTPTYHVFDLYQGHQDATLLPITLEAGAYTHGGGAIPAISASASQDASGTILLTLANLDPNQPRVVEADLRGADVRQVTGRVLTAAAMNAHNTFANPTAIQPAAFAGATLDGDRLTVRMPAKSVVALTLE